MTASSLGAFNCPAQRAFFDSVLQAQGLDPTNNTTDTATAAGVGNVACKAVLDYRHLDKSNQNGEVNGGAPYSDWTGYQPVNTPDQIIDPNRWQPLRVSDGHGGTFVQKFIAPHWGRVVPFAIRDWDRQVIAPVRKELRRRNGHVGPVTADDPAYKQQADEVIAYSASLVDSQKVIAEYWADGPSSELPPGHWVLFAQTVSARDQRDVRRKKRRWCGVLPRVIKRACKRSSMACKSRVPRSGMTRFWTGSVG